uniref:Phosphoribulokinase/uridine kinase domain-containing protein n=1 Tax=Alexandrium monilatum TaxID=311494 RepID=A0A7S4Q239_9DINO
MPAWLCWVSGVGEWVSPDGTQTGEFRVVADLDWATLDVYNGPEYLEEDNPIPLLAHTLEVKNGGRAVLATFSFLPVECRGEVLLDDQGCMNGTFTDSNGEGRYVGTTQWYERPYTTDPPRPKDLFQREPTSVRWQVPPCLQDGRVLLLGIGGASRSGKGTLARSVSEALCRKGLDCVVVHQDNYIRLAGSYLIRGRKGEVEVDNFETPASISWRDFTKAINTAAKKVTPEARGRKFKPGIVIAEGFLLYWMKEINEVFRARIFLRASRQEVSFRRQESKPMHQAFLEHVFWPAHLAYGQPQAPVHEIIVEDGQQDFPLPIPMLRAALEVLRDHGGDELHRALTQKASPGRSSSSQATRAEATEANPARVSSSQASRAEAAQATPTPPPRRAARALWGTPPARTALLCSSNLTRAAAASSPDRTLAVCSRHWVIRRSLRTSSMQC